MNATALKSLQPTNVHSSAPRLPDDYRQHGWAILEHPEPSPSEFDPLKLDLYELSAEDIAENLTLADIRTRLLNIRKIFPTACAFEHFYGDHSLISGAWFSPDIGKIYFLGTVYADSSGDTCVRCLCFERGQFRQKFVALKSTVDMKDRIVVIKND